jgi:L-lactate dehydrogenase complex protein LldG
MDRSSGNKNLKEGLFKTTYSAVEMENKEKHLYKGPSSAQDLDVRFAENFSSTGGKFIYCESIKNFVQLMDSLKKQNDWNHVYIWDHNIKNYINNLGFKQEELEFFMDNSDAAMSDCFALVADQGVILLTPDQATNRRLTSFPPNHIIIASKASLIENLEKGLDKFTNNFLDKLPSLIELNSERNICKANHARLLNASGTPNVYVFYVDVPQLV